MANKHLYTQWTTTIHLLEWPESIHKQHKCWQRLRTIGTVLYFWWEGKMLQPLWFPKGNQSWKFNGKTDAEAEAPMLWPPGAKNWLIRKDPEDRRRRDNRGWDGWVASLTQWTWVWASSGSWWWTGKPGLLQSMGLQSQTRLNNWTDWQPLWKTVWKFLTKLHILLTIWSNSGTQRIENLSPHRNLLKDVYRSSVYNWQNLEVTMTSLVNGKTNCGPSRWWNIMQC